MSDDAERCRLLVEAYLRGEITDARWREYLAAEPGLRNAWLGVANPMAPAPGTADHDAARLRAQSPVYRRAKRRALYRDIVQSSLMLIGAATLLVGLLWASGALRLTAALLSGGG